jgi:glycosyltransferase involved in cell wall biosynthesis
MRTILHAAKLYPPAGGGMETVLRDLCDGMAEEWGVRVVAANDRRETVRERCGAVDVVRAGAFGRAASVPLCPTLPAELWRRRADCVVLHEPNPIAGTALFMRRPAPRLVVWHHSDLLRPWWAPATYGRIQRALYRRADCVIVSSPALAAASPLVRCAKRVAVIPFGVAIERFDRADPASRSRAERIVAAVPGPRMLFVGRLVYYKGLEVLLEAMRRGHGSLVIAGEGPLESTLRSIVSANGLAGRVHFAGRVPDADLPALYRACDVFVLPSIAKTEAFGVVQIEAMAAGRPVVSTNLPTGVPWVNQDGVSGLVVPVGDAAALGAALQRLLNDDALRSRLGEGARLRAATMFSRERMVAAFKNVVETVVDSPDFLDAADWCVDPDSVNGVNGVNGVNSVNSVNSVDSVERARAR